MRLDMRSMCENIRNLPFDIISAVNNTSTASGVRRGGNLAWRFRLALRIIYFPEQELCVSPILYKACRYNIIMLLAFDFFQWMNFTCVCFTPECTKMRLVARLRADSLEKLTGVKAWTPPIAKFCLMRIGLRRLRYNKSALSAYGY